MGRGETETKRRERKGMFYLHTKTKNPLWQETSGILADRLSFFSK